MGEKDFRALQERIVSLIEEMEDGGTLEEPGVAIDDLKALLMLATRAC